MNLLLIAIILGIVEGLTEFIPVSSTGHLILVGNLLNFQGLKAASFEIFIQCGAMLAALIYVSRIKKHKDSLKFIVVSSIPAIILGLLFHKIIKLYLFNPISVTFALAVGGLLMILWEKMNIPSTKKMSELNLKDAFLIGCFQCLALWPGVSRSAATILGAMYLGYQREVAAQYSFMIAIPILFLASTFDMYQSRDLFSWQDLSFFGIGTFVSFVTALLAMSFFIQWITKKDLKIFGYYRIAIALAVLLFGL